MTPAHIAQAFDRYHFEDFAFKVVGVGSVGMPASSSYLAGSDDPLLLQVKEARPLVLAPYAGRVNSTTMVSASL